MASLGFVSGFGSVLGTSQRRAQCLKDVRFNGLNGLNGNGGRYVMSGRRRRLRICMEVQESKITSEADEKAGSSEEENGGNEKEQAKQETQVNKVELSPEEKLKKAAAARIDAEKLERAAERARIEFERAQLQAEASKLELEKTRLLRLKVKPGKESAAVFEEREKREKYLAARKEANAASAQASEEAEKKEEEPVEKKTENDKQLEALEGSTGFMSAIGPLADIDIPKVSREDVQILRDHVFSMETFYVTQVETSTFGDRVVFRGNLRISPDKLLGKFEESMKKHGVDKRVRLFIMEDPVALEEGKPVVIALPKEAEPRQPGIGGTIFSLLFFLGSAFTTLGYGIGVFGATPEFLSHLAEGRLDELVRTFPISGGVMGTVLAHELGHRVAAYIRGVKLGIPFFIPSLQIGSFGTVTPLTSFPKTRSDFFDVAMAGPGTGMVLGLGALIAGLLMTGSAENATWFPQVPSVLFQNSILIGSFTKLLLPAELIKNATLAVHPLAVIGYTTILINALNLIPVGRLDGGRIVQALFGRVVAGQVSGVSLLLQGLGAILGNSPILLFWGLVGTFFQSRADIPCQDEVTEPDTARSAIGLAALLIMVLVLAPFPETAKTVEFISDKL